MEDTDAITFEEIEATFGLAVRKIVEGETKVSGVAGWEGGVGFDKAVILPCQMVAHNGYLQF